MNHQKAIYIDLNGVIANLIPTHLAGWSVVNFILGKETKLTLVDYPFFQGKRSETVMKELIHQSKENFSPAAIEKLGQIKKLARAIAIERLSSEVLFPSTIELIKNCKRANVWTVCFSNSRGCPKILDQLKISHYFDEKIYGDMVRPPKPKSAKRLEAAINEQGFQKQNCLYLEDNQAAILHARKAKIPSLLVTSKTDFQNGVIAVEDLNNYSFTALLELAREVLTPPR